MDEMILEVDEKDAVIGLRARGEFYNSAHIHRACQLILLNSKNMMLLQKRASSKQWYPNLYTYSVSGTVGDESYDACIRRETSEEIGISIPFKRLFKVACLQDSVRAFHMVYFGRSDSEIHYDRSEASLVKWVRLEDLRLDLEENSKNYVPALRIGLRKFFEEEFFEELY